MKKKYIYVARAENSFARSLTVAQGAIDRFDTLTLKYVTVSLNCYAYGRGKRADRIAAFAHRRLTLH